MIDVKKLELMQRLHSDDKFVCFEETTQVIDGEPLVVEYEFNFEDMKTWLLACARETPQPRIKILNETTGEYL